MVFVHDRVRAENSTAKTYALQMPGWQKRLTAYEVFLRDAGSVRMATGADNGVQLRHSSEARPPGREGSEAGMLRCHAAVEAELGYNAKLQDCENFRFERLPRSKTLRLTGYAAHILRESCAILERDFGKEVLFVTATLPGSTKDALDALAIHSRGILNAFMQNFRDATKHELEWLSCAAWEYQKRGALHLHLVIGVDNPELQKCFMQKARKWWLKTLRHYSKKTGIDMFAKTDGGSHWGRELKRSCTVEKVRKSVSRYMSKYLSKDARRFVESGFEPPSSWWYLSDDLRKRVLAERRLEAVKFISLEEARAQTADLAALAQEMGGTVFETRNPFSDAVCGYQVYFDNGRKDEFWELAAIYMCLKSEESRARAAPVVERREVCWKPRDYCREVELMFDGVPLQAVRSASADLCAPSSASEEGGGRW